jgi:hypothetical protein
MASDAAEAAAELVQSYRAVSREEDTWETHLDCQWPIRRQPLNALTSPVPACEVD